MPIRKKEETFSTLRTLLFPYRHKLGSLLPMDYNTLISSRSKRRKALGDLLPGSTRPFASQVLYSRDHKFSCDHF